MIKVSGDVISWNQKFTYSNFSKFYRVFCRIPEILDYCRSEREVEVKVTKRWR
jgi:hypothetical protein